MPVVLAYRLWKSEQLNLPEYWDMVRRAADFIADFGPWSPQERWEEIYGASPSTIAAEIAALWTAGEIAHAMGDDVRARRYRMTGDAWAAKPGDNVQTWLVTTTGGWGDHRYYTRVQGATFYDEVWNPDTEAEVNLGNGAGRWREKDVTDAGFLELVRFGVKPARDRAVAGSMPEIDETIRVDIAGIGPGFRRYLHDRYNYEELSGAQTPGMPWPLLTGERGHYELQRALEGRRRGRATLDADQAVAPFVAAMEKMATPSSMLPEQVWDFGDRAGQSTGSATPLGWSHGEYLKLLRSRMDQAVFDRLPLAETRAALLKATGYPLEK